MYKLPEKDLISICEADQIALSNLVQSLKIKDSICVEIGSYIGTSANALLRGGAGHVYCIDLWSGGPVYSEDNTNNKQSWEISPEIGKIILGKFIQNTSFLTHITPLIGDSLWWAEHWPFKVDLIFIDGNHEYESVKTDIEAWWPNLKIGGLLCGHDFCETYPGVMKAVSIFPNVEISGASIWSVKKQKDLDDKICHS